MAFTRESLRQIMQECRDQLAKTQGLKPLASEHQAIIDGARERHLDLMADLGNPAKDAE